MTIYKNIIKRFAFDWWSFRSDDLKQLLCSEYYTDMNFYDVNDDEIINMYLRDVKGILIDDLDLMIASCKFRLILDEVESKYGFTILTDKDLLGESFDIKLKSFYVYLYIEILKEKYIMTDIDHILDHNSNLEVILREVVKFEFTFDVDYDLKNFITLYVYNYYGNSLRVRFNYE